MLLNITIFLFLVYKPSYVHTKLTLLFLLLYFTFYKKFLKLSIFLHKHYNYIFFIKKNSSIEKKKLTMNTNILKFYFKFYLL